MIPFQIDYQQGKASGAVDALSRFSPIEGKSSSREHSSPSPGVTNGPSSPKFVYKTHVLPLLLKFWRCAPEEDVLVQDQFDGGVDVEGVVHHQGLSYVPEVIRTELISRHHDEGTLASIQLKNSLSGNPREICSCRYRLEVYQLRFDPYCHRLADMSHDSCGIAYVY